MKIPHILLALVVMALWGSSYTIGKLGIQELPPLLFGALRQLSIAILLLPVLKNPGKDLWGLMGVSVTIGNLFFSFLYLGMRTVDASTGGLISSVQAIVCAILAYFFLKESVTWRKVAGIVLGMAATVIIVGTPGLSGTATDLMFVFLSAISWAVGMIQIKKLSHMDGLQSLGWWAVLAFPQMIVMSLVFEGSQWPAGFSGLSWTTYYSLFHSAVFNTLVAYLLWLFLMKRYPVGILAALSLTEPLFAVLIACLVLGESLGLQVLIGGLLMVAGVALVILPQKRQAVPDRSSPSSS
ncbi:MAG: EamA family transporter [Pseudomonadota bacterium]|nr:EamA family transporter [Pseudomonadota bacterium]